MGNFAHTQIAPAYNKGALQLPSDRRSELAKRSEISTLRSKRTSTSAIRAYLEDVFNGHNVQSLDKYLAENLVSHWLGDRSLHGRQAWGEAMANFFDAFPDAAYTLNDSFFAGDKGVWRGTWHATQRKEWESIPATGRRAKWTVIIIGRFDEGKLAEDWVEYDRYNLFRQLGAL